MDECGFSVLELKNENRYGTRRHTALIHWKFPMLEYKFVWWTEQVHTHAHTAQRFLIS